MGEVEFYLVQHSIIKSQVDLFKRSESEPRVICAHYIGSDYTYAYSQKFRDTIFRDNTLDENLLIGVSAKP